MKRPVKLLGTQSRNGKEVRFDQSRDIFEQIIPRPPVLYGHRRSQSSQLQRKPFEDVTLTITRWTFDNRGKREYGLMLLMQQPLSTQEGGANWRLGIRIVHIPLWRRRRTSRGQHVHYLSWFVMSASLNKNSWKFKQGLRVLIIINKILLKNALIDRNKCETSLRRVS